MMGSLVTFFLIGLVALVALSLVAGLIGLVFSAALSLAGFLLFKVAPVLLLGYLVVRFLAPRQRRLPDEERTWLEGD